jgi:dUTP pyrophosphatase
MAFFAKFDPVDGGKLPTRGSEGAAAFDCYARGVMLKDNGDPVIFRVMDLPHTYHSTFLLGFRCEPPAGYHCEISGRSGLSKRGIVVQFGICDGDYRGEYAATLINLSGEDFTVNAGDRICQMRFVKDEIPDFVEVGQYYCNCAHGEPCIVTPSPSNDVNCPASLEDFCILNDGDGLCEGWVRCELSATARGAAAFGSTGR